MDIEKLLDSVPTPTSVDMDSLGQLARSYILVFLRKGPASNEDDAPNERLQLQQARALAEADPRVKAGYLTVEAIPWMAVPGKGL